MNGLPVSRRASKREVALNLRAVCGVDSRLETGDSSSRCIELDDQPVALVQVMGDVEDPSEDLIITKEQRSSTSQLRDHTVTFSDLRTKRAHLSPGQFRQCMGHARFSLSTP